MYGLDGKPATHPSMDYNITSNNLGISRIQFELRRHSSHHWSDEWALNQKCHPIDHRFDSWLWMQSIPSNRIHTMHTLHTNMYIQPNQWSHIDLILKILSNKWLYKSRCVRCISVYFKIIFQSVIIKPLSISA